MKYSLILKSTLSFAIGISSLFATADDQINPNYFYIYKGEPVNRGISLGDPDNWSTSVTGREGKSASGAISVKPVNFNGTGDAIQLTWHKKIQGNFSVYGSNIDLAKYKDSVSLTIDMRIDQKPKADVKIGMDCSYPCRADLKINKMIKSMKVGEWFSLPIPLNCMKSDNFDLSKINGPFTISTSDSFAVSITNVRLEKMPEGEKGCAKK